MGRRKKEDTIVATTNQETPIELSCLSCGKDITNDKAYVTNSIFFKNIKRLPYCKNCINKIYNKYVNEFQKKNYKYPEKKAIQRFCMAFDYYYSDQTYDNVFDDKEKTQVRKNGEDYSPIMYYLKHMNLIQYQNKSYLNTIADQYKEFRIENSSLFDKNDVDAIKDSNKLEHFFGKGFTDEEYRYLEEQYRDWTTRHECQTKSQEEMFKNICFTQLQIWREMCAGGDTKNLQDTLLKQMDAAKLQPKQNKGDTISDAQTFGTLIEKWETTKPISETSEELKDVDKLGLLTEVFVRGHTCKMLGVKNAYSNLYEKVIKDYTVNKPEYDPDSNSEILFDAIFGKVNLEDS